MCHKDHQSQKSHNYNISDAMCLENVWFLLTPTKKQKTLKFNGHEVKFASQIINKSQKVSI